MSSKVTPLDTDIAARLKALRKERELTQSVVAKALGVSYQTYQKMEGGKVSFRASTLAKLSDLMLVPLPRLIDGERAPSIRNGEAVAYVSAKLQGCSPAAAASIRECVTARIHEMGEAGGS